VGPAWLGWTEKCATYAKNRRLFV